MTKGIKGKLLRLLQEIYLSLLQFEAWVGYEEGVTGLRG